MPEMSVSYERMPINFIHGAADAAVVSHDIITSTEASQTLLPTR